MCVFSPSPLLLLFFKSCLLLVFKSLVLECCANNHPLSSKLDKAHRLTPLLAFLNLCYVDSDFNWHSIYLKFSCYCQFLTGMAPMTSVLCVTRVKLFLTFWDYRPLRWNCITWSQDQSPKQHLLDSVTLSLNGWLPGIIWILANLSLFKCYFLFLLSINQNSCLVDLFLWS